MALTKLNARCVLGWQSGGEKSRGALPCGSLGGADAPKAIAVKAERRRGLGTMAVPFGLDGRAIRAKRGCRSALTAKRWG